MTGRPVIPVRSMSMRLPEAGRIRIGTSEKATSRAGKAFDRPVKLDRFRFTSADPKALQEVADAYGGQVVPWTHAKAAAGQHELITDAREIRIALPPDPLGGTPLYELWDGGGCSRRCDGEQCDLLTSGEDGLDLQQVPCLCAAKGELACKVTTHLSVLLPEVRFVGVWRLTSHGWNAAQELPGMVELIRSLQDRGVVRGLLRVEARTQVLGGKLHEYMVPVLGVDESVDALAAGAARLGALGAGSVAALGTGEIEEVAVGAAPQGDTAEVATDGATTGPGPTSSDDDIVDAELVDVFDADALVLLREAATSKAKQAKALVAARRCAERKGIVLPLDFDEIREPVLVAAALEAIA